MGRHLEDICKMTILYVDDDPDIVQMVCSRLSNNYPTQEIVFAENAFDALIQMREDEPDIFILDLYMPFIGGLRLAEAILSRGTEYPILFLSVCADEDTIRKCFDVGAVHYLRKPIDFDLLFYKLDNLMVEIFLKRFHKAKMRNDRQRQMRIAKGDTSIVI